MTSWGLVHVSRVELSDKILHQDSAYTDCLSHLIHWPLRLFKEKQYCFRNKSFWFMLRAPSHISSFFWWACEVTLEVGRNIKRRREGEKGSILPRRETSVHFWHQKHNTWYCKCHLFNSHFSEFLTWQHFSRHLSYKDELKMFLPKRDIF